MEFLPGDEEGSMRAGGLTFDTILAAPWLDFIASPTRPGQSYLIVEINRYAVVVPCKDVGNDRWLMVTAWYDRKFTKHYLP